MSGSMAELLPFSPAASASSPGPRYRFRALGLDRGPPGPALYGQSLLLEKAVSRIVALGFLLSIAAITEAGAVMIDPLTRQPVESYGNGRPQSTIVPRQEVSYAGPETPGTIIVATGERRLYYVLGPGRAMRYGVGVGRPGFDWYGVNKVSLKREWPDWRPPAEMLRRRPDLPAFMPGGPDNPLGARALYIGSTEFQIHGSNEPETIGQAVSSGCIRMTNEDVVDLFDRVQVGARVIVQH
jgi:lipoprotein-anchoring transpeptidase ErfK/SrfK